MCVQRWDFVHGEVEYYFAYDRPSCASASAAAPTSVYINYSPYGPWNITFDGALPDGVESIRLEFLLVSNAM